MRDWLERAALSRKHRAELKRRVLVEDLFNYIQKLVGTENMNIAVQERYDEVLSFVVKSHELRWEVVPKIGRASCREKVSRLV